MKTISYQRRLPRIVKPTNNSRSGELCVSVFRRGLGRVAQALVARNGERRFKTLTIESVGNGAIVRLESEVLRDLRKWVNATRIELETKHAARRLTIKRKAVNRRNK